MTPRRAPSGHDPPRGLRVDPSKTAGAVSGRQRRGTLAKPAVIAQRRRSGAHRPEYRRPPEAPATPPFAATVSITGPAKPPISSPFMQDIGYMVMTPTCQPGGWRCKTRINFRALSMAVNVSRRTLPSGCRRRARPTAPANMVRPESGSDERGRPTCGGCGRRCSGSAARALPTIDPWPSH